MLTVYLDQNKWIELAKALYRTDATPEARDNAEKLKQAVAAGRLRCPVSEIHLMEAYRIGDRDRRLQLASVFAAFSGGWFIAGRQARVAYELDAALSKLLSIPNASDRQPFDAFAQNFLWAFGDPGHLSTLMSIPPERLDQISSSIGPINALLSYVRFNDENVRRTAQLPPGAVKLCSDNAGAIRSEHPLRITLIQSSSGRATESVPQQPSIEAWHCWTILGNRMRNRAEPF